jgi:hypothetical protein
MGAGRGTLARSARCGVVAASILIALAPAAAASGPLAVGPSGDVALLQDYPRPLVGAVGPLGGELGPFVRLHGGDVYDSQVVVTGSGEAVAAWSTAAGVMTAAAPRGGRFGTPRKLAGQSSSPVLAIAPAGEVLVAWTGSGNHPRVASRLPGRQFGKPTVLPDTGHVAGLAIDARGKALLLTTHVKRGVGLQLRLNERPAGGDFGPPLTIRRSGVGSYATLAAAPNGRALVVWSATDGLVAAVRAPGGSFGQPMPLTDNSCSGSLGAGAAGISDDGYALVAWGERGSGDYGEEVGDGCFNTARMSETLPDGSFSRPIDLGRPSAPARRATVAVDGPGNAAVAVGDTRFRVAVRFRQAGGQMGDQFDLAGPRLGGFPALAIAPDGAALAAWSENDGDHVRIKLRSFRETPDAPARTVSTRRAFRRGKRSTCFPPGSKTLLQTRTSRVFKLKPGRVTKYACYFPRGKRIALDYGFDDFPVTSSGPPAMALNGPLLATIEDSAVCGACVGYSLLEVYDLRTGDEANGYAPDGPPGSPDDAEIDAMVVSRHASLAWATCSNSRCPGHGTGTGAVWAYPAGTVTPKLVDRGKGIVSKSLRLRGTTLSWLHDGKRRRIALTP